MEIIRQVYSADELYELLKAIPEAQRKRLPVILNGETGNIQAYAYEVTETEGCIERGLQIDIERD